MKTIQFTDCEAKLVSELLEHEWAELKPEIHHTDTAAVIEKLEERFNTVTRLIERLSETDAAKGCGCKKHSEQVAGHGSCH